MCFYYLLGITASIVTKIFFIQIQITPIHTDETPVTSFYDSSAEMETTTSNNDDNYKENKTVILNNTSDKFTQHEDKKDPIMGSTSIIQSGFFNFSNEEFQPDSEELPPTITSDLIEEMYPNDPDKEPAQPANLTKNTPPHSSRNRKKDRNLRKSNQDNQCINFGKICAKIVKPIELDQGPISTEKTYWDSKALSNLKTHFLKVENVDGELKMSLIKGHEELKKKIPKDLVVSQNNIRPFVNSSILEPVKQFLNLLRQSSHMNDKDFSLISFVSLKDIQNITKK